MYQRPALLGQVRLAQIPSWGPGTAPAPMSPMSQNAPAAAPAPAAPDTKSTDLASTVYAGGIILAITAGLGALLA